MNSEFKLAFLGCGQIAHAHLAAAGTLSRARPTAFCDIVQDKADAMAEQVGASSYTSYRQLLAEEQVDGAVVCSPPGVHKEMVLACIEHGVPVLCEKPLADIAPAAAEMVEASEKQGVLLMTAFVHRHTDLTNELRKLLDSGRLGTILLAEFSLKQFLDLREAWHGKKGMSGGGVFADAGVHLFDLAHFLFGQPDRVTCAISTLFDGIEVEDSGIALLQMKSGPLCSFAMSFAAPQGFPQHLGIFGSEGAATGTLLDGVRYKLRGETDWTYIPTPDHFKGFAVQLDHFIQCAKGESQPIVTGREGLLANRVLEMAYAAARAGTWRSLY